MLIGEVARRAGVSRDTVRLYTRLGLVDHTLRDAGSRRYAEYEDGAVDLILGIKVAQSLGFTLAELGPIAASYTGGSLDAGEQARLLRGKLADVEEKRRRLVRLSRFLREKIARLEEEACPPPAAQAAP